MSDNQQGKKLVYFLERLDPSGLDGLDHYLRSPLFANSTHLAELLAACMRHLDGQGLDVERIHSELFPDKKWAPKRAKYLQLRLVQLLNHLLDFQALLKFREDEHARYLYRLDAAIARGWDSYIPFMYTQATRNLPELPGAERYGSQLRLETRYNSYLSGIAVSGTDTHLDEVHGALDAFFLLQKLKYATAAANRAIVSEPPPPDPLLDLVLDYLNSPAGTRAPAPVQAYAQALRMIRLATAPSDAGGKVHFEAFRAILENQATIARGELIDLYTYALNFCTVRIHLGEAAYIQETKRLYERVLDMGVLLESGQLAAGYYKNIVNIMCRFGELAWAEAFVEEYRDKIASDPDQLAYLYNKAVLAFHRNDFAATVRLLYHRINEFADILFGIAARNYLCRALWEQEEYQWLGSNLVAFRVYLKRQKELSETDRRIHLLYVKYFEQILNAQTTNPDRSRKKLEAIREKLSGSGEGAVFRSLQVILDRLLA